MIPLNEASLWPAVARVTEAIQAGQISSAGRLPWDGRVHLDLWYVDHWTLGLDFRILKRAFLLLFLREGVYFTKADTGSPKAQADQSS